MADSRRAWARALFAACSGKAGAAASSAAETRRLFVDAFAGLVGAMGRGGFRDGLEDPSLPKGRRVALLEAAIPASSSPEAKALFDRFARLLVDKGRISLLPAIGEAFGELVDAEEGITRLDIEAARDPGTAEVGRLAEAWGRSGGGRRVESRLRLIPSLLGGYRLRSGSIRYDYSIAGRVERLRRHLSGPSADARPSGGA